MDLDDPQLQRPHPAVGGRHHQVDLGSIEKDGTVLRLAERHLHRGRRRLRLLQQRRGAIAIYQIAVATFTNANGLQASSGGLYREIGPSGSATTQLSGSGGAGTVYGSTLEA